MNDAPVKRFDARRATSQLLVLGGSLVAGLSVYWLAPKQATTQTSAQGSDTASLPQGWDSATNAVPVPQNEADAAAPGWTEEDNQWEESSDRGTPTQGGGRFAGRGQSRGWTDQQAMPSQGNSFSFQPQQAPQGWSRGS